MNDSSNNNMIWTASRFAIIVVSLYTAYTYRLYAIEIYGLVIHEFDPWFNFRATQYLADNGWTKFFSWFDYKVWYPLGRPVGTTIYPGMQISSVAIWRAINALGGGMSLNDVCCYVPAWFGSFATGLLAMFTYECSGSLNAATVSALIMSIIPAHMMRSVGGGYDNESVAMSAMVGVFYFWCRSLRNDSSWWYGAFAGLTYIYMVAAWGGYIFVLNMVGVHAFALVLMQRYSSKLHRAYSLFYIIGTFGAIHVPVVGWTPLKSLEQLPCLLVFLGLQVLEVTMIVKRKMKLDKREYIRLLVKLTAAGLLFLTVIVFFVVPSGYFGPISSRVRGLFLKHTRTGNPLVDSVAEHQPASNRAYYQYLQCICYFAPIGFMMILSKPTDSRTFLILYGLVAYFFSAKMVRLVLLLGPIASSLGGIAIANMLEWSYEKIVSTPVDLDQLQQNNRIGLSKREAMKMKKNKKKMKGKNRSSSLKNQNSKLPEVFRPLFGPVEDYFETMSGKVVAKMVAGMMVMFIATNGYTFFYYSIAMAKRMSNPSLMYEATLRNGEKIMIDDYREAYWWLRDNTPEDSRVMAWWDYGYQITGIGERTTIADGNTWNHEHIATLGRCLVSPEEEAHQIVRHLADYVLVWTGGGGDDLAKSPHMARISNSVYSDICPGDPTCRKFGFMDRNRTPKPMMAASLLYKLHSHNKRPGVSADPDLFEEVYV